MITSYDKILGAFLGAAVGDAMGAATEIRTIDQIKEYFGGFIRDFKVPPADTFARGRQAGQITDDFSQAYYLATTIINNQGRIDPGIAKEAIINWSNDQQYNCFMGPTTRASLELLKSETKTAQDNEDELVLVNDNQKATNGSAMKIFPIGLINAGNIKQAIDDAVTVSLVTHDNNLSIAGACAIAAAVCKASEKNANLYDVVQAGLAGARQGNEKGLARGRVAAGPSVYRRIKLAIELGLKSKNIEEAMIDIAEIIGCGLHIAEAVPAVFGLLIATKGDTMEGIFSGVNIGNDTDTVATMIGAIAGTLNGYHSIPGQYLTEINSKNNLSLEKLAKSFERVSNATN